MNQVFEQQINKKKKKEMKKRKRGQANLSNPISLKGDGPHLRKVIDANKIFGFGVFPPTLFPFTHDAGE